MSSARAALLETLASYLGDRKLLALIGTTVTGVALNAHSIRSQRGVSLALHGRVRVRHAHRNHRGSPAPSTTAFAAGCSI